MPSKFFFDQKKNDFLTKMVKNNIFSQKLAFFVSILQSVCFEAIEPEKPYIDESKEALTKVL